MSTATAVLNFRFYRGGVYLPSLRLWLDPHESQMGGDRVFISHAHSDHTGAHREVILTPATSRLMRARVSGDWEEHTPAFGETRVFEGPGTPFRITLFPAGHIFGSAMALVEAGGESLLYTGDFKLRPGLSAERCQPQAADVLIMETTYGRPGYRFPPSAAVIGGVVRFCREALENEETPILLGYSLGKSQELLCGLAEAELPIALHAQAFKLTQIYQEFGLRFPPHEKFSPETGRGKVVLCPPSAARSPLIRGLGPIRTAVLTGWAVDLNCRYRYQADAAFALSDHADFPDLIEFVKAVSPRKVFTLHGFAADFAQSLRDLGYDAQALSEEEQLALPLAFAAAPAPEIRPAPASEAVPISREAAGTGTAGEGAALREGVPAIELAGGAAARPEGAAGAKSEREPGPGKERGGEDPFHRFAATCAAIGGTPKKLEKAACLAGYFQALPMESLGAAATWFTGQPFASSRNKVLQLGWALIRDALCGVGGLNHGEFGQVYLKHSDLGETAFEILGMKPGPSGAGSLGVSDVEKLFERLYLARGPLGKLPLLAEALRRGSPLEGKYLVKILTGDLRIGLKEGLVEEAIAEAFDAPLPEVKQANLLLGHIGETAVLARRGELASASLAPFRPVKFMLASPEETAAEIWTRAREWGERGAAANASAHREPLQTSSDPRTAPGPGDESGRGIGEAKAEAARAESAEEGDGAGAVEGESAGKALLFPLPGEALSAWVEDKYDGIRCQLHKAGGRVALYSRDLKEITTAFLDVADPAAGFSEDLILDGEIIACRGREVLPFSELQKRLGRREGDLFLGEEIPAQFVAFDLLWVNGQSLLRDPLRERRKRLEAVAVLPAGFRLAEVRQARGADQIDAQFGLARDRGNEGLMIKDPGSVYSPGRRGLAWLKLKKAFATLDCVVVGAEYGHGKRKAVLSDYTFAVRDGGSGALKTIGKAYSGLTDAEIAQLTKHFLEKVIGQRGRFHEVEPDTVLEIAFDSIQASGRHSSGLAMRFPRIVRIRTDKTAADIDTLETARGLVKTGRKSKKP